MRPALRLLQRVNVNNRSSGRKSDKLLFTPGPLLTSWGVKMAATHDLGSRDTAFIQAVKDVRSGVLRAAELPESEWTMIPMQGSGTFGIEATLSSVVPKDRSVLIIANGAYGLRQTKMAKLLGMNYHVLQYKDNTAPDLFEIENQLQKHPSISHVSMVHSETTSGIINDIKSVGELAKLYNAKLIVDGMSSFGGIPIDFKACNISYLVTSANKCLQGIPGFSIIIAHKECLAKDEGNARVLSLDIHDQVKGLDSNGQFRFTPPTHAILACQQALLELEQEGGIKARNKRYRMNRKVIDKGLTAMGFKRYLPDHLQGPIISTYQYPADPNWSFEKFYNHLNNQDLVIYPGKITDFDCFRIGHIGHLYRKHCVKLVKGVQAAVDDLGIKM